MYQNIKIIITNEDHDEIDHSVYHGDDNDHFEREYVSLSNTLLKRLFKTLAKGEEKEIVIQCNIDTFLDDFYERVAERFLADGYLLRRLDSVHHYTFKSNRQSLLSLFLI